MQKGSNQLPLLKIYPSLVSNIQTKGIVKAFCSHRSYLSIKYVAPIKTITKAPSTSSIPEKLPLITVSKTPVQINVNSMLLSPRDGPIIDTEVPKVIAFSSSRQLSVSLLHVESIPPLPNISDSDFESLFLKKLEICSEILDFTSNIIQIEEKDQKSRILCELVQFFEQSPDARKLSEKMQEETFKMIEVNIFRQNPIFPSPVITLDYSAVIIEPSWPQLFYIYQILNRFVSIFPNSPMLSIKTAKTAIYLTNLPDNNERLQLLAFLRSFYDTHPSFHKELILAVQEQLTKVVEKISPPFCVTPLLVFLSHIFNRSEKTPLPEYFQTIRTSVFPLILSKYLPLYHQHLIMLYSLIFTPASPLINQQLQFLFRFWPQTNGLKQPCYVEMLHFVTSRLSPGDLVSNIKRILSILSSTIMSSHAKVVEASLDVLQKPKPEEWIVSHSRRVIMTLYDSVKTVAESHWSSTVQEKAGNSLIEMGKLNRKAFLKARNAKNTTEAKRKTLETERECAHNWSLVVKAASDTDPLINEKAMISEVKGYFKYKNPQPKK